MVSLMQEFHTNLCDIWVYNLYWHKILYTFNNEVVPLFTLEMLGGFILYTQYHNFISMLLLQKIITKYLVSLAISLDFWLNFCLLPDILSRLKIVCLEKSRDEAKKKYRSHKSSYVNNCLGRPLEKLSVSNLSYIGVYLGGGGGAHIILAPLKGVSGYW